MESATKKEVIKQSIKQVMMETTDDDDDHLRLSKLMSQLEGEQEEPIAIDGPRSDEEKLERILKELKKVRRQNVITHCLLSVMIVLTVAWQISEVSIILKLKDGVTHPFRSIGRIFKAMMIKPQPKDDDDDPHSFPEPSLTDSTPVHHLQLPHLGLPKFDLGFPAQD